MSRKHVLKFLANDIERKKIFFQFTLMLTAALIGGICFVKAFESSISYDVRTRVISSLTLSSFADVDLGYILKVCLPYFISVPIIFIFSFSYVSYVISDIILALNGFITGALVSLVALCLSPAETLIAVAFIISAITSLLILLYFAHTCALLSLGIRLRATNGRMIIASKSILLLIIKAFAALGTVIILTLVRSLALLFFT